MDNVGIVVESLDAAISFFAELGLELEGRAMIEGDWSGRVTGLRDQRVEIAMMRTPDGHGRIELSRFLAPPVAEDHRTLKGHSRTPAQARVLRLTTELRLLLAAAPCLARTAARTSPIA
jgi:catechol 2,3-dioxygenase-like lactoylglutathione lyase family enzyme